MTTWRAAKKLYKLWLEKSTEKDLNKLPPDIFPKVISKIKALAKSPKPIGCRKIRG